MLELLCNELKLVLCIVAISLILIIRDIIGVNVSDFVLTGICALSMMTLKYEKMVYYIFFLFPIMCGAPGYIITIAYLLLVLKGPKLKSKQIVPLIIVALLEVINESFNNIEGLYTGMLSFLSFTAIFFYFLDERESLFSVRKCLIYYGLGATLTFIVIYSNMFIEYGLDAILTGMLRSGALGVADNDITKMQGHLAMNANTIAYLSVSVVTIFYVMLSQNIKDIKNKWLFIVIIIVSLVAGLLSFSRTFVGVVFFFAILFIFLAKGKEKIKLIVILATLSIVVVVFCSDILLNMYDTFLGRMEDSNMDTAGGRTILFQLYNKAWLGDISYIIFGAGVVSYWKTLHVYNAIHNGLQQIWVCLGIIGFLTYIVRISTYLYRCYIKKNVIIYLPFFATLLIDQSIQFLNPYPLVLILLATLQLPKMTTKIGRSGFFLQTNIASNN